MQDTQKKREAIVQRHRPGEDIHDALFAVEMRNLQLFGYGIKGLTLSMVEAAIQLKFLPPARAPHSGA